MSDPDAEFLTRFARHAGLAYVELDPREGRDPVDPAVATTVPAHAARALAVAPVRVHEGKLVLALQRPDPRVVATAAALTRRAIMPVIASAAEIARAQERLYGKPARWIRPAPAPPRPGDPERYRSLAQQAGVRFLELDPDAPGSFAVNEAIAQLLPERLARRFGVLPVSASGDEVLVASSAPFDTIALRVVGALTGHRPQLAIATPQAIERATARIWARAGGTIERALPELDTGRSARSRLLGTLLVETGLVREGQIADALAIQERTGSRLGEVLLHGGVIDERDLVATLAQQLRLPGLDVSGFEPDDDAVALVPESLQRHHRFVPLTIRGGVLYVAMSDPLDDAAYAALREHTDLPIRAVLSSPRAVGTLLERVHAERSIGDATTGLLERSPEDSAYRVLSHRQKILLIVLTLLFGGGLIAAPIATLIACNAVAVAFYTAFSIYKFKLMLNALGNDLELPVSVQEVRELDERTLPVYTILVPLYREAAVVGGLARSIAQLDYPRAKLDIKLIVEEDDDETVAAIRALRLPPHFKVVVVPDTLPKTKPKACNYGLIQAEGKYVVIYDAEDRPDADQLKKIVVAFRKAEERIVCIQCKLNYYNRDQNILTRWFTSEYSNWFDLLMPGLDASDAPIPLGGTSNHFIADRLRELNGWDPFNVTEDADLGIRLHKSGFKTAIIDSSTYEEANCELYNWIRQRSRWVKGYIQTWLVHMRHPVRMLRTMGWRAFVSFQLMIGGTVLTFVINPVYWLLTTLWILTQAGLIRSIFPGYLYFFAAAGLVIGNFVFAYVNVAGAMRRRYYELVRYALLSPLYWALMSIGAWKGLLQLLYRPFYWEKTVHGLTTEEYEKDAE